MTSTDVFPSFRQRRRTLITARRKNTFLKCCIVNLRKTSAGFSSDLRTTISSHSYDSTRWLQRFISIALSSSVDHIHQSLPMLDFRTLGDVIFRCRHESMHLENSWLSFLIWAFCFFMRRSSHKSIVCWQETSRHPRRKKHRGSGLTDMFVSIEMCNLLEAYFDTSSWN